MTESTTPESAESAQSIESGTVLTAPVAADVCDVCGHPTASHDRIALRFCAATQAGALSRGCLCKGV
jgi:hypothetical protein